jgi:hypothetical protein
MRQACNDILQNNRVSLLKTTGSLYYLSRVDDATALSRAYVAFLWRTRVAAIDTRHVSQIGGFSRAKDESRARFPQVRATIACARESRRGESRGRTGLPSAAKTGATRARTRIPARLGLRQSIDRQMPRLGTAMDPAAVGDLAVETGADAPPRPPTQKKLAFGV